jgi:hypothetical protein
MWSVRESRDMQRGRGSHGVILPSQFYDLTGARGLSSEQRLMLAVLADAINMMLGGVGGRAMATEAAEWIFAPQGGPPLSFERVCEALSIDPTALRERLAPIRQGRHAAARAIPSRLRLKESTRVQHLTVNRVRNRSRSHRPTGHR